MLAFGMPQPQLPKCGLRQVLLPACSFDFSREYLRLGVVNVPGQEAVQDLAVEYQDQLVIFVLGNNPTMVLQIHWLLGWKQDVIVFEQLLTAVFAVQAVAGVPTSDPGALPPSFGAHEPADRH